MILRSAATTVRTTTGVLTEVLLVFGIAAAIIFGATLAAGGGPPGADPVAAGAPKGSIQVVFGTSTLAPVASTEGSIFTAYGCGFRASSPDYYMVVRGPAPDTESVAYWVDPFGVGSDGCGSSTVSWISSGVPGDFDVWVVRSPSGNPWLAKPASNTVTITITTP